MSLNGLIRAVLIAVCAALVSCSSAPPPPPSGLAAAEARMRGAVAAGAINGLAMALIEEGRVTAVRSAGQRNAAGDPLQIDTVMYGASLTKAVFAYTVLQLVDEGRLDLDASIARYLDRPLPDYPRDPRSGPWPDLKEDARWRALTPRLLLTHRSGFANFAFLEPDGRLRFHFEPGSRYAYSGEGLILLQFVIERGLGLNLGDEMQRRVFDRFGMTRTRMMWRPDFRPNLADGVNASGQWLPHDERGKVRAAGSMDTTIDDFSRFAAGVMRGDGLSAHSRAELTRLQAPITTATQFPSLQPELPLERRRADLGAGLGVVVFDGPQGPGFFKGGHDDQTANTWVCLERRRACVVLLSNDVRAEPLFPGLVHTLLGQTGVPWTWEYGEQPFP